ncbi:MAG: glutamine--tRNA ligase/YqeY domain fusion protein [Gemmatimonadetes bacterium]|nr:glutamine--tRNA ligase/YqeY domain fusion protein [Gemmatimonadota bacterium]
MNQPKNTPAVDFIRTMIADDVRSGKYGGRVVTRFPPEPNGYLHIGHAKAICVDFGVAEEHGGECHLRFDDTNPTGEDIKYAESIQEDVRWLGFTWSGGDNNGLFFASDYFEKLYEYAEKLIEDGKAYVDSSSDEEIRTHRGTVTEAGTDSPHRTRTVEENLDLFRRMRAGEFAAAAHVLRAKIDMAAPNMLMRDPILYRILRATHYRAGDAWCIYPLYDFAHSLSDAIENVTHSLCSLEFKDNREVYDWVLDAAKIPRPRTEQTEFARLELDYTVLSKRKLIRLVEGGHVTGWDDPRLPTIAGLRRRGVTPESIRAFCGLIGVARVYSRVDVGKLEYVIRDDLNQRVPRVMCVLHPLKVVITNYPEGQVEQLDAPLYPRDVPKEGSRQVPFSRELYIERDDFMEDPPKKFFRLVPGGEVRLRYAYLIKCEQVIKDPNTGAVLELRCTYDPETRSGTAPDGRKVKGTLHWVSAAESLRAQVRLYDRLFTTADPDAVAEGEDFTVNLNTDSLVTLRECRIEPSVVNDAPGTRYQFERQGYFCSDIVDSSASQLVFNRTVGLRDSWTKTEQPKSSRPAPEPRARGDQTERLLSPEIAARAKGYVDMGLVREQGAALASDPVLAKLFDDAMAVHENPKAIAGWVVTEMPRELKERSANDPPVSGAQLGSLVALIDDGTINRPAAKQVLAEMVKDGGDPGEIVAARGLEQISDSNAVAALVEDVIASNGNKVAEYQAGRTGLLGFFVGQVMKESGGKANPELVQTLVRERLT